MSVMLENDVLRRRGNRGVGVYLEPLKVVVDGRRADVECGIIVEVAEEPNGPANWLPRGRYV